MKAIDGYKTFILAAAGIVTVIAHTLGYIDYQTMFTLLSIEGFGSVAALRDAIKKIEDHVLPVEVVTDPAPVVPVPANTYVPAPVLPTITPEQIASLQAQLDALKAHVSTPQV